MQKRSIDQKIIEPNFLLNAYCNGYFPMADCKDGSIGWYSPDPRGIFDLNEFTISRSLRSTIRKKIFDVRIDTRFEQVIHACSEREETWISNTIIRSYMQLHELGYAHSIEAWKEGQLSGGLYGVAIRGAFFGESMFSKVRDASKVALCFLVDRLKDRGFTLLDTQYSTPHLVQFGVKEISREEYMRLLEKALQCQCTFFER